VINRWYQEAVIYSVDVSSFQDSDGDGRGDLRGLISRLDYLSRLGISCLWLNPIHPSPWRDNGYDISDYYGVHPALGSLGDFAELVRAAQERGIRIVLDLVVNHTSDEHPWFKSARSRPDSPYRDWYVWSTEEPPDRRQGTVFPGEQEETWTFDEQANAWYFHRFYGFQPDLNWANPDVRAEIAKVMTFWLQVGAAGFRIDAAPFILEQVSPGVDPAPKDFSILDTWRQETQWLRGDSVLLCEANVPPSDISTYVGSRPDGPSDRAQMMFDFLLNPRVWLALARSDAEPLVEALNTAVGQLSAKPRRTRPQQTHRRTTRGRLPRLRAPPRDAVVRPWHSSPTGTDAAGRSPPDRARVCPTVLTPWHAGAAVRRGDWDGRRPNP
jgi:maltose alpha-D-glucosyltransferase / alpha-amylase